MAEGIIFDVQRFSVHDGPGIRTAIFMKGCPLRCLWCQNPESVRKQPQISYTPALCIGCGKCVAACPDRGIRLSGKNLVEKINLTLCVHCGNCAKSCFAGALQMLGHETTVDAVCQTVMADEAFYRESGGGVTFTGGEPTYQPEFFTAMAKKFKRFGLHQVIETCGFFEWTSVADALSLMDIFYLDIKHTDNGKHLKATGVSNTVILENAQRLDSLGKPIRIRVPLIPGFNDSRDDFLGTLRLAATLKNLDRVQVLPYHKFGVSKYDRIGWGYPIGGLETPTRSSVSSLLALAKAEGVPCIL